ncbi:MAG: zinc-ribbon domain-containing protein [Pseudomonadota bacterium]
MERRTLILTCENCSSRFLVDPQLLQPRGRRVRCARCKFIWFQAPPEADSLSGDADMRPSTPGEATAQVVGQAMAQSGEDRRQIFRRSAERPEEAEQPGPFSAAEDMLDQEEAESKEGESDVDETDGLYADDPSDAGQSDAAPEEMPDLPWNSAARQRKSQVPAVYKERSALLMVAGWVVLAALVLSAFGGLILARETIAAKIPGTKPVYAAIGMPIEPKVIVENVARYLKLETPPPPPADLRDGMIVQEITGTIINIADAPVKIPTLEGILRDRDNKELYRWLFSAEADILYPGQRAAFATEIVDMPQEAVEMELVFAEGRTPGKAESSTFESSR